MLVFLTVLFWFWGVPTALVLAIYVANKLSVRARVFISDYIFGPAAPATTENLAPLDVEYRKNKRRPKRAAARHEAFIVANTPPATKRMKSGISETPLVTLHNGGEQ